MRKSDRTELIEKIRRLANLPPGKDTQNYFTRGQLLELVLFLEAMIDRLRTLSGEKMKDA